MYCSKAIIGAINFFFWDLNLIENYKNLDINTLPHKLYSVEILSLEIAGEKLMVVTKGGDVIQIVLEEERQQNKNSLCYKFITERSNNIFQLKGDLKAMCLEERVSFLK